MKFTTTIAIASLLAVSEQVNGIKVHNAFIDNSNVQIKEDDVVPAAEKK